MLEDFLKFLGLDNNTKDNIQDNTINNIKDNTKDNTKDNNTQHKILEVENANFEEIVTTKEENGKIIKEITKIKPLDKKTAQITKQIIEIKRF